MAGESSDKQKPSILELLFRYLYKTSPKLMFIHLAWLIIASCVISLSYIAAFHFTSLIGIYREAHNIENFSSNLRSSARQDQQIQTILQALLDGTNSKRAYVFRYHNGLAAISGVPFFFQTMTHEVISPGISRLVQFEQRIPASINIAVNNQFADNQCAVILNTELDINSQNHWYFQTRGAKSLIRCPIFVSTGDLFGFVGVDYHHNINEDQIAQDLPRVREAATQIAQQFANMRATTTERRR